MSDPNHPSVDAAGDPPVGPGNPMGASGNPPIGPAAPAIGGAAPPAGPAAPPVGPGAPPAGLTRSPLSDGEWHRLHPLTPVLRGGLFLVVVIGVIIANLRDRLFSLFLPWLAPDPRIDRELEGLQSGDPVDWVIANNLYLAAALAVLAVLLALTAWYYLSWRFHMLRITGDDVEVRSGILFRTQRRAPLDRVQGVNLTRPMIARLLGMAKLEVVGAGTDANVRLEYLSTANAEAVRADILRLASGRRLADAAVRADANGSRVSAIGQAVSRGLTGLIEGDEAPVAVPESVVHIPIGRLVASHLISPATVGLVFGIAAIVVAAAIGTPWLLVGMFPAVIGFIAYWVRSITRSLRYSIAPTPDGVRITFGLLTSTTEIVPPGRVHAVEVSQSVLWRPAGWWSIRINRLSGRALSDANRDQFTTVLPVGTIADVERVLQLMLPHVPAEEWAVIVRQGVLRRTADDTFTNSPSRSWWLHPLSWRRNGFRLTRDLLLLRRGAIWRKVAILPLARLQSLGLHQGPIERMLRLASARAHIVSGPVFAALSAIDRDEALGLFAGTAAGAVQAASADRSHRWAQEEETA